MNRVYLAGRYDTRLDLVAKSIVFNELGFTVTSRWLRGEHSLNEFGYAGSGFATLPPHVNKAAQALAGHFAQEDLDDVRRADWLVSFTEPDTVGYNTGGRHVEHGYMLGLLALGAPKEISVVGPRENVFHFLPSVDHHADWEDFLRDRLLPMADRVPEHLTLGLEDERSEWQHILITASRADAPPSYASATR